MQIEGAVCVVTGGASGIGRALAQELASRDAAGVVVADLDVEYAGQVADRIGGLAVQCDVGDPAQVEALVAAATERYGRVDVFRSNAGYSDPVVYTGMFGRPKDLDAEPVLPESGALGEMLLPEDVAVQAVDAMEGDEPFLILPHPRVGESLRRKVDDYDAWIDRAAERVAATRESMS